MAGRRRTCRKPGQTENGWDGRESANHRPERMTARRIDSRMRLTEESLLRDLELLRHGGAEAVALFMDMAQRLHQMADDALHAWVTVALPALPERERAEVVLLLMIAPAAAQPRPVFH